MKATSGLFTIILVVWMGASSWWYVCKIKDQCNRKAIIEVSEIKSRKTDVDKPVNVPLTKEEILEDVKTKIATGYTINFFPENSTENNDIEKAFYEFADNLEMYLQQNSKDKILLTGHTDNVGSDAANIKFGIKRAMFVKSVLTKKGIEAKRIIIKSKGEKEPIATNESDLGRNQNRRVVIKLIDK